MILEHEIIIKFLEYSLKLLIFILPVFLYAEIHFKFPFFKGFLYKKQPEIIFDLPSRICNNFLPVLLLIKDASLFPVHLDKVYIQIFNKSNGGLVKKIKINEQIDITDRWFSNIYQVDVNDLIDMNLEVCCEAIIKINNKEVLITNHNYSALPKTNFNTFIDSEYNLMEPGWICGDLHVHSSYTEDQIEFGAPADKIIIIAKSMGLSFSALLDHSYDLDDYDGLYNKNDPGLKKWKDSRQEIGQLNLMCDDFKLLPGMELSVDNGLGENVHMGIINDTTFFQGTGDGGDKIIGKESEFHYSKVLDKLSEKAISFAAHPTAPQKITHNKILKRGEWNTFDFHNKLSGFQIMNGKNGNELQCGKKLWLNKLLYGHHYYIYAGNDAHGNFNWSHNIEIPFLTMNSMKSQIFGLQKTCVKADVNKGVEDIINKLKNGEVIVTEGPFINIHILDKFGNKNNIGSILRSTPVSINISAKSSNYFGNLKEIRIYLGSIDDHKENVLNQIPLENPKIFEQTIPFPKIKGQYYIRAELETTRNRSALTNPIWINL